MALDDRLAKILQRMRRYASFFWWHDKAQKELWIVKYLLESMQKAGDARYQSPWIFENDPPDCIVHNFRGERVAMEVREFVSQEAVARNERGEDIYRNWEPREVLAEIEKILREKDGKSFNGGPFAEVLVVIHCDEPVISYEEYRAILESYTFTGVQQVTGAYFLFSYDPDAGRGPYVRLRVERR